MGYLNYKLSIQIGPDRLIKELRKENKNAIYAINDDGYTNESCKWHEHEKELKIFSQKHPKALFKLEGNGEETGDIWIKYFQNGKCQVCKAKITFDEFNYNKFI